MLKSMTAYGRASFAAKMGHFVVEIQSVNRKHLEMTFFMPRELSKFEGSLRKLLSSSVFRGQVTVKITAIFDQEVPVKVLPNLPLARQLKNAWDAIAKELNLSNDKGFTLDLLADTTGIILYEENFPNEAEYEKALEQAVRMALENFLEMRVREGVHLEKDILARLGNLKQWVNKIAEFAPRATEKYRTKLKERIEEVLAGAIENEERILREVAVFAEKVDIAEEVTRFNSHLVQFDELIRSDQEAKGKTLEFLLQELNRETNTIGSKASDVEVARLVIEIKSELERIREQIQNVE